MGINLSRYFVSASFYVHFYFYKRKEKKIDKTKRYGRSYISGTVIDPDLSDFQDNFQGDFSEFLTSCFQGKKGWYRISQNDEVGKLPHRSVFGERLELII